MYNGFVTFLFAIACIIILTDIIKYVLGRGKGRKIDIKKNIALLLLCVIVILKYIENKA